MIMEIMLVHLSLLVGCVIAIAAIKTSSKINTLRKRFLMGLMALLFIVVLLKTLMI